jgi:hypothetical protein
MTEGANDSVRLCKIAVHPGKRGIQLAAVAIAMRPNDEFRRIFVLMNWSAQALSEYNMGNRYPPLIEAIGILASLSPMQ